MYNEHNKWVEEDGTHDPVADTAMERWEAWARALIFCGDDTRDLLPGESQNGIRLAVEAAPIYDLVQELKRRGVLEQHRIGMWDIPVEGMYRVRNEKK